MIIVITYSCISTMYTIGFNVKIQWTHDQGDQVIYILENVVLICFTIDIIFNFMRLPA